MKKIGNTHNVPAQEKEEKEIIVVNDQNIGENLEKLLVVINAFELCYKQGDIPNFLEKIQEFESSWAPINTYIYGSDGDDEIRSAVHNIAGGITSLLIQFSLIKGIGLNEFKSNQQFNQAFFVVLNDILLRLSLAQEIISEHSSKTGSKKGSKEELIKNFKSMPTVNAFLSSIIKQTLVKYLSQKELNIDLNIPDNLTIDSLQKAKRIETISSIFNVFIDNAGKHAKKHIKISLSLDEAKNVVFEVTDDGDGIPDSFKDKIFVEGQTTDLEHGHGVGLYLAKKIAKKHGGSIGFSSLPGETKFWTKIPFSMRGFL